jgi:integrase
MVKLQRLTGMRPSEVCGLKPCDINRAQNVWIYEVKKHKTAHHGRRRLIPLGPRAQEIVIPYLGRSAESFCFSSAENEAHRLSLNHAQRKTPPNQGNAPGKNRKKNPRCVKGVRYDRASYARAVARAAKKAGVGHWRPYQLRHALATQSEELFGVETASVLLGHARPTMTEHYVKRDLSRATAAALKMG